MASEKLSMRKLPDYTKGEEIMNMVTHIVGGAAGIVALVGLLLIVIPVGFLLDLVFFIMGIATIVVSLPALISLLPLRGTRVGKALQGQLCMALP